LGEQAHEPNELADLNEPKPALKPEPKTRYIAFFAWHIQSVGSQVHQKATPTPSPFSYCAFAHGLNRTCQVALSACDSTV
jgi:hypothetical protein